MVSEITEANNLLTDYGVMIAEVIILTVISALAYFIRSNFNSHNQKYNELKELIPRVIILEEQLLPIKDDITEMQKVIHGITRKIDSNQLELRDRIDVQYEKTNSELKSIHTTLGKILGYIQVKNNEGIS